MDAHSMTIYESIVQLKILKEEYDKLYDDDFFTVDIFLIEDDAKAIEMAIASLEAWEKVKAEIDESRDALKTMIDGEWFAGKLKGLDCAVAIINKHLQEVTE